MKLRRLLLIVLIGLFSSSFAKDVPKSTAEKVAQNYYYQAVNNLQDVKVNYSDIKLNLAVEEKKNGSNTFYAFNVNHDKGFVLVSADDRVKPVLAYSFDGSFNKDNIHPGMEDMLEWYDYQINFAKTHNVKAKASASEQWTELLNYTPSRGIKNMRNVEPLMLVHYSQGHPYNLDCPADANAQNGHVPVGCVAVAMVQVMKYYDFPHNGTGSNGYTDLWNGYYGYQSADFANTYYNWEGMPLKGNGENGNLSQICYHAGVSVEMDYNTNGSGSSTQKAASALRDYFKYDHGVSYQEKSDYSETNYINMLKTQINSGQPMIYSGRPQSGAGHAWNCDGYMNNEFHMNWGWEGSGDGYFTLDNLLSQGTIGGAQYDFSYDQACIINIYPESNYPTDCSGLKTINASQGSFGDGSADEFYESNLNCHYKISPDCGNVIKLSFKQFELGSGDVINIYDGGSTSSSLLDSFDETNPPDGVMLRGSESDMLIEFITDGSSNGKGWYVDYDTDYCKSNMTYTAPGGAVEDGSGDCQYRKSTVCSYIIEPQGATNVTLDFLQFDLAGSIDFLKVYENSASGNLVATYDANNSPSQITVNSTKVFLQFYADSDNDVGDGWTLHYGTMVNVNDETLIRGVELYPNPAKDIVNLAFSLDEASEVKIRIHDITGRLLNKLSYDGVKGYQKVALNELVNLPEEQGVYIVEVIADGRKHTEKLNITK